MRRGLLFLFLLWLFKTAFLLTALAVLEVPEILLSLPPKHHHQLNDLSFKDEPGLATATY